jgi:hypothetical protein
MLTEVSLSLSRKVLALYIKIFHDLHIFSQVMHFIVAWLCAVQRGKGTDHPIPFNSWFSMPHSGGMGCAVCGHVCMQVCVHARASSAGAA